MLGKVLDIVEHSKQLFHARLVKMAQEHKGMPREVYVRYLSFQYHLTRGVQRHFLALAAHPQMADKTSLREFLFRFAMEEEPHFKVAEIDLQRMGEKPLPCPLDVSLWWAYFDKVITTRPFVRLGATCVLENLGAGAGALGHQLLDTAPYLNKENTRFLQIHFHEALPHGDQIIKALSGVTLSPDNIRDLEEGVHIGSIMYLRMADWAMKTEELTVREFDGTSSVPSDWPDGNYTNLDELVAPALMPD